MSLIFSSNKIEHIFCENQGFYNRYNNFTIISRHSYLLKQVILYLADIKLVNDFIILLDIRYDFS